MKSITDVTSYLLQCMYIAKLPLLLLPKASLLVPCFGVALAVSPPYLLSSNDDQEQNERLHPWQVNFLRFSMNPQKILEDFWNHH